MIECADPIDCIHAGYLLSRLLGKKKYIRRYFDRRGCVMCSIGTDTDLFNIRYFVLRDRFLYISEEDSPSCRQGKSIILLCPSTTYKFKGTAPRASDGSLLFKFSLSSEHSTVDFAAESEDEFQQWSTALLQALTKLKTGVCLDGNVIQRQSFLRGGESPRFLSCVIYSGDANMSIGVHQDPQTSPIAIVEARIADVSVHFDDNAMTLVVNRGNKLRYEL